MSSGTKVAKPYDVFFIGFCLMMSGIPSMWNMGLAYGFWEFFLCTMIMSVGYMCLTMCLAEMTSILPFSGGSYGFARVSMGPYIGFVIGCFDSMSNTFYALLLVECMCMSIVDFMGGGIPANSEPVQWLLMYIVCLGIMIGLGRWSFTFISILGIIMMCTCIGYVACSASHLNFENYVLKQDRNVLFDGHVSQFMRCLPIANWLYLGPDMMCLVCDDTENAKHVVPRCIVACMAVTILIIVAIIISVSAQSPGFVTLATLPFPLNPGFSAAFGLSDHIVSIFMLPISFAGVYCLLYIAGRQMCAMARSKLLPYAFTFTTKDNAPYVSLIASGLLGYGILLVAYLGIPNYVDVLNKCYFACLMCTISVYLVSCVSFILFRIRYFSLEKHYENRCGVASAVLAIIIFAFSFVGCAGFSHDGCLAVKVYFGFIAFVSVFYFCFARNRQTFSPEEKSVLLKAYVLKANSKHRTVYNWIIRNLKRAGSSSSSRRIACEEPEIQIMGNVGQLVKPKSSSKEKSIPFNSATNVINGGNISISPGAAMFSSQLQSMVLFDIEDDATCAVHHEMNLEDYSMEQQPQPLVMLKQKEKEDVVQKEGWIDALRSLNGSYRLAPVLSE